jgi:DNA primase
MSNDINIESFDFERYLNVKGIPFDNQGKNVQSGWLAIQCPFCDDPSNHMGINPETNGVNCWRCPAKGTVIMIVMKIERLSSHRAILELQKYTHRELSNRERSFDPAQLSEDNLQVRLPSHSQKSFEQYHAEYLLGRGFDPDSLTKHYKLQFTNPISNYRMRIVVPIYMSRRLVSFTTRDVTGKAHIPWVHGKPDHVILSPKECLYNIDTVTDTALVVEGASDVWRIGDGAVATFGDKYTVEQVRLLQKVKRAFILFDTESNAQENASKLAYDLSSFVSDVHIYQLDQGDPGDLSDKDVLEIRTEIFGRKY